MAQAELLADVRKTIDLCSKDDYLMFNVSNRDTCILNLFTI